MGFLNGETIISNSAYAIYDASLLILGILSSRMHVIWVRAVGGKLKSDYRYSSLCYNSFPFPQITKAQENDIRILIEEILFTRENYSEKTLAEMYDPDLMPNDLRSAHQKLDSYIESCYQSQPFDNDEHRLESLFRLYEKMSNRK